MKGLVSFSVSCSSSLFSYLWSVPMHCAFIINYCILSFFRSPFHRFMVSLLLASSSITVLLDQTSHGWWCSISIVFVSLSDSVSPLSLSSSDHFNAIYITCIIIQCIASHSLMRTLRLASLSCSFTIQLWDWFLSIHVLCLPLLIHIIL